MEVIRCKCHLQHTGRTEEEREIKREREKWFVMKPHSLDTDKVRNVFLVEYSSVGTGQKLDFPLQYVLHVI